MGNKKMENKKMENKNVIAGMSPISQDYSIANGYVASGPVVNRAVFIY